LELKNVKLKSTQRHNFYYAFCKTLNIQQFSTQSIDQTPKLIAHTYGMDDIMELKMT